MGKNLKGKEIGKGLTQTKDGRYSGRFTNRFGKRVEFKGNSLNDVKKQLQKAIYEDEQKLNIYDTKIILDKWFEQWINVHKYGILKQNSKMEYIGHYKKHIGPYLGKMKLIDIGKIHIKELINQMDKSGYGYEMKNRTKIMLLDMFDKAMQDEMVNRNPAKGIKIVRDEKKEPRVLSREEQSFFFNCSKGTFYDNLFVVCVNTGLRPGEAAALTSNDIDFSEKSISVSHTLIYQKWEKDTGKTIHIDSPKTKSSIRKIPMNSHSELALKKQIKQKAVIQKRYGNRYCEEQFQDLLFTTKFNTPVIEQNFIDAIKRIVVEINSMRDELEKFELFTPHCFRHTFATRCIESGMKPKVLQKILGHATLQMTMDLYAHVSDDIKSNEMELLENEMDNIALIEDEIVLKRINKDIKEDKATKCHSKNWC